MPKGNLEIANKFAKDYDENVLKNNWTGPSILHSLVKEYIQPGQKLLDLGIGTGAGSLPFYNDGIQISGIDGSQEMINECKKKNFAHKLILFDLEKPKLPFESNTFKIIISNALLHLINPIDHIFNEAVRLLINNGLFVFTYDDTADTSGYKQISSGIWEMKTETGIWTYKHDSKYITTLLEDNGFVELKQQRFLAFTNKELKKEYYFTAIVARKS